jgi:hypothetical protein
VVTDENVVEATVVVEELLGKGQPYKKVDAAMIHTNNKTRLYIQSASIHQ